MYNVEMRKFVNGLPSPLFQRKIVLAESEESIREYFKNSYLITDIYETDSVSSIDIVIMTDRIKEILSNIKGA